MNRKCPRLVLTADSKFTIYGNWTSRDKPTCGQSSLRLVNLWISLLAKMSYGIVGVDNCSVISGRLRHLYTVIIW